MNNPTIICDISVAPGRMVPINQFKMLTPDKNIQEKPSEFASIAHELRNPLSTISLAAEMLKSTITNDDQQMFLDMIIRGSMRINDMLADIYSFSRGHKTAVEEYSIHQLLEEVLTMAGDKVMLNHITIEKNYDAEDFKILLNGPQIKIALTNIIINAIEAMTPGEGELTVVTKSNRNSCVVQIGDNGCGISPENLKKIFTPYFTNKPNGLGLGLTTTLDILRSNHVALNIKSVETEGTTFRLVFEKQHS